MLSVIRKCCVENSTGINIRVSFAIFQECISSSSSILSQIEEYIIHSM